MAFDSPDKKARPIKIITQPLPGINQKITPTGSSSSPVTIKAIRLINDLFFWWRRLYSCWNRRPGGLL